MIGKKIRQLRKQKDMTQKSLASMMNVADSTISNWEHGRRQPSISELMRLADLFSVSLSEFDLDMAVLKDVTHEKPDMEMYQSIHLISLGFHVTKVQLALFAVGLALIVLSVLMGGLAALTLWLNGLFVIVWVMVSQALAIARHHGRKRKQFLISMDTTVYYKHQISQEKVRKKRTALTVLAFVSILLSGWQYIVLLVILSWEEQLTWVMIIVLYALCTLLVGVQKFRILSSSRMINERVSFDSSFGPLDYHVVTLAVVLDTLAFIFVGFELVINPLTLLTKAQCVGVLSTAAIMAMISFLTFCVYQKFLNGFDLYAKDRYDQIIHID